MLRKNKHHSRYLQSAYNKYGEDAFVFESYLFCPIEELIPLEQYLMDYYQSDYNIRKIADSNYGLKRTDEQKQNISNSLKGRKLSSAHIENSRKGIIKYYQVNGPNAVSQETREKLRQANLGKILSPEHREKLRISHLGYKVKEETKEKLRQYNHKRPNTWQAQVVQQINIETQEIINTFISAAKASELTGVHYSSICKAARGEQLTSGGFIWKYQTQQY